MNLKSIRWRLPLTYAGIALITALVLGGTLLAILQGYYQGQESDYLRKNASAIGHAVGPFLVKDSTGAYPMNDLENHLALLAFLSQTRVRLIDPQGTEIVDYSFIGVQDPQVVLSAISLPSTSDSPSHHDPSIIQSSQSSTALEWAPDGTPLGSDGGLMGILLFLSVKHTIPVKSASGPAAQVKIAPGTQAFIAEIPAVETMYGFDLQGNTMAGSARSHQIYSQRILASDGTVLGSVELSDGPSVGWDIVVQVAQVWVNASLMAIFVAALAGWWISQRMSAPILALTEATGRMAQGDLSVRAERYSQDELGALAQSFNEMAGRTEEMVGALRRFAGDAAHELNTPLATLHASLDLVGSDPALPDTVRAYVEQAWEETHRMETLSRDLLDLSRLEANPIGSSNETVDMRELVRAASETCASQAEQRGIQFELEISDRRLRVVGPRMQLSRVVGNLLENALKFTPTGGQVRVTLNRENLEAILQIEDTGVGIPAEDLPFVFHRFHRGRNATSYPGSGLGLAMVKAIVDRHGGKIGVESLAIGTKVELCLPCIAEEPSEPA